MTVEEKSSPRERLELLKRKAEVCYAKMYDCEPHNVKDFRDDASSYLAEAARLAGELGLESERKALEARVAHVQGVFNQLRTDGGRRNVDAVPRSRDYKAIWMWLLTWGYVVVLLLAAASALAYRFLKAR